MMYLGHLPVVFLQRSFVGTLVRLVLYLAFLYNTIKKIALLSWSESYIY